MHTANCPLCGCVHNVPMFFGSESPAVQCISCRAWFHFTGTDGKTFGTRLADRMSRPEPLAGLGGM